MRRPPVLLAIALGGPMSAIYPPEYQQSPPQPPPLPPHRSWPRRHKILTALGSGFGLLVVLIIVIATMSAPSVTKPGTPQQSHADQVACRMIYRLQGVYDASGGLPVFAPGAQAAQALAGSDAGTSQPLNRDMNAAEQRLLLVNTPTTAQLVPMERDCAKLGITAKNAENAS
jgi:hypothetical protein